MPAAIQTEALPSRAAEQRPTALLLSLSLLAAFGFLYLRTVMLPATPILAYGDEALHFGHAIRILHGQVPFRGFFLFVMPGLDLFYAAVFGLFGVHAWLVPVFLILLGTALTGLVFFLARKVVSGPSAVLAALLFLVLDFNSALDATHHWFSTFFALAAAAVLLKGTALPRLLAAGTLCGISTVFTQTQGTLGLLAIAAYLLFVRRQKPAASRGNVWLQLAALVGPFLFLVGGTLGYYSTQAGVATLQFSLGYFALHYFHAAEVNTLYGYVSQLHRPHNAGEALTLIPFAFIYALVPFAYLVSAVHLYRTRAHAGSQPWQTVLLLTLVGFALFLAVASGPTYHRLCMVAPPAIAVSVYLLDAYRASSSLPRVALQSLWALAAVLLVYLPVHMQLHWTAVLQLPTGKTAILDPEQADACGWLAARTHPGEPFFSHPVFSFALLLENPTPVDFVAANEFTRPEQAAAVVRGLEDHRTPLVLLYPDLSLPWKPGDNLGPLHRYLGENYRLVHIFRSGQVWQRK
jgi:hypothetical protein